jgi:short-subunit dehydrogenase
MPPTKAVALITGASLGLGREYARLFAADGHDVVLVARTESKLRELATELEKKPGVKAHVLVEDLGDAAAPDRILEAVQKLGLEIEFLVNNAGFGSNGSFWKLDVARETEMVQVNVTALLRLTRLFLPQMVKRGHGRVLNIASTAAFVPGPFMATYYASKAFVVSHSEALAYELRGTGVTVTAHCPGATQTEFARTAGNDTSVLFKLAVADARHVASHGYRAMLAGRVVSIYGVMNWLLVQSQRLAPRALLRAIAARLNRT